MCAVVQRFVGLLNENHYEQFTVGTNFHNSFFAAARWFKLHAKERHTKWQIALTYKI